MDVSMISLLPPELILRILTFVADVGGPPALRQSMLVCRCFHEIIDDPLLDKYIWKACAQRLLSPDLFPPSSSLAGTLVPPTPATPDGRGQKLLHKSLAKTVFLWSKPFPASVHHPSTTALAPGKNYTTRYGPNPEPSAERQSRCTKDEFTAKTSPKSLIPASAMPPLTEAPHGKGTVRRVVDFVHSATEASRAEENVAYVGVKTCGWSDSLPPPTTACTNGTTTTTKKPGEGCAWILFTDSPREFAQMRYECGITIKRAAVLGGSGIFVPEKKPEAASSEVPEQQQQQQQQQKTANEIEPKQYMKPVDTDNFPSLKRWCWRDDSLHAQLYKEFGPPSKDAGYGVEKEEWATNNLTTSSLVGFGMSLAHSDANLRLVPRLVKKKLEVAKVERLALSGDGVVVNMAWRMPPNVKDLILVEEDGEEDDDDDDELLDDEMSGMRTTWEFKSCARNLIVCDDNSGRRASTISCFDGKIPPPTPLFSSDEPQQRAREPSSSSDLLWQRKMLIRDPTTNNEYFLDNDGFAINSTVVVYATRRHIAPTPYTSTMGTHKAVMEFHVLSLATGDTIKICNLPEEERFVNSRCYMWCSFALGDGVIVGSLGGYANRRENAADGSWALGDPKRYGFKNVFVWDLAAMPSPSSSPTPPPPLPPQPPPPQPQSSLSLSLSSSSSSSSSEPANKEPHPILPPYISPTQKIPCPKNWGESDKYLTLSTSSRYLAISTTAYKLAVWDMESKSFEGLYTSAPRDAGEDDEDMGDGEDEDLSWNGVWIMWRDLLEPPLEDEESSGRERVGTGEKELAKGVVYIPNKQLRKAVQGIDEDREHDRWKRLIHGYGGGGGGVWGLDSDDDNEEGEWEWTISDGDEDEEDDEEDDDDDDDDDDDERSEASGLSMINGEELVSDTED